MYYESLPYHSNLHLYFSELMHIVDGPRRDDGRVSGVRACVVYKTCADYTQCVVQPTDSFLVAWLWSQGQARPFTAIINLFKWSGHSRVNTIKLSLSNRLEFVHWAATFFFFFFFFYTSFFSSLHSFEANFRYRKCHHFFQYIELDRSLAIFAWATSKALELCARENAIQRILHAFYCSHLTHWPCTIFRSEWDRFVSVQWVETLFKNARRCDFACWLW